MTQPPLDPPPPGPVVNPPDPSGPSGPSYGDPSYPGPSVPAPPGGASPATLHPWPQSKKMAGWALGLAIVPCAYGITTVVAVGLAITVLVRSRGGPDHGRRLAIAALCVAAAWVVVAVAVLGLGLGQGLRDLTRDAERDADGGVSSRTEASVMRLRVGDCFDAPPIRAEDADGVASPTVTAVPCAQPHHFEAYRAFDLTGKDYPGDDQVSASANSGCLSAFRGYVGIGPGRSTLPIYFYQPTAQTWRLLRDREVLCFLGDPDTTTTGSLRGSRSRGLSDPPGGGEGA